MNSTMDPGFHPKNGDALKIVTRESIASWRQAVEAAADRKRKEQERQAQEVRDRLAQSGAGSGPGQIAESGQPF
jgi:hypothetical protein